MNRTKKKVASLIIPTYNKEKRFTLMLETLYRVAKLDEIEIIIINNGSTDSTWRLLERFIEKCSKNKIDAKYYTVKNIGRSQARNFGIEKATGEILIFADDDVLLSPNFLQSHLEQHKNSENLVVHGKILNLSYLKFFKDPALGVMQNGNNASVALKEKVITIDMIRQEKLNDYLKRNAKFTKFEKDILNLFLNTNLEESKWRFIGFTGGNVSLRKKLLLSIEGFDENLGVLWGCEDLELGYRLYQEGCRFVYNESAVNYHMDHYRADYKKEHAQAMMYFVHKYNDFSLEMLRNYFSGECKDLLQWKNSVMKGSKR